MIHEPSVLLLSYLLGGVAKRILVAVSKWSDAVTAINRLACFCVVCCAHLVAIGVGGLRFSGLHCVFISYLFICLSRSAGELNIYTLLAVCMFRSDVANIYTFSPLIH